VLFVSHNMAAIRSLCSRAVLLGNGSLAMDADTEAAISSYLSQQGTTGAQIQWNEKQAPQCAEFRFIRAAVLDDSAQPVSVLDVRKSFWISAEYEVLVPLRGLRIGFFMQSLDGTPICGSNDPDAWTDEFRGPGRFVSRCLFPGHTLNHGTYSISLGADVAPHKKALISTAPCLSFMVEDVEGHGPHAERLPGVLRPALRWEIIQRGINSGRAEP